MNAIQNFVHFNKTGISFVYKFFVLINNSNGFYQLIISVWLKMDQEETSDYNTCRYSELKYNIIYSIRIFRCDLKSFVMSIPFFFRCKPQQHLNRKISQMKWIFRSVFTKQTSQKLINHVCYTYRTWILLENLLNENEKKKWLQSWKLIVNT